MGDLGLVEAVEDNAYIRLIPRLGLENSKGKQNDKYGKDKNKFKSRFVRNPQRLYNPKKNGV